jgi:hypothetical protein
MALRGMARAQVNPTALEVPRKEANMVLKDWLEVIIIPVSLAMVALIWPLIQDSNRRRAFMNLIRRELKEIGPYPEQPERNGWWEHMSKNFVHQRIVTDVSPNRDFLLSLDPDVAYKVSQLWNALGAKDDKQWLFYLGELSKSDRSGELAKIYNAWNALCNEYREKSRRVQSNAV